MAENYCGGANWWDPSSANRNRFDAGHGGGGGGSSSTSSTSTTLAAGGGGGGYGWLTEAASTVVLDINAARSSLDSLSGGTQDPKMDPGSSSLLVGLGLSSQVLDWSQQPILNQEKADNSFRSVLQEGMGLNPNFQQDFGSQLQWRDKLFSSNEDSMESTVTCQGLATPSSFQLDSSSSSSVYCSPSSILQGFIGPDQQHQQQAQMNYHQNYFDQQQLSSSWGKVPQFLRGSPSKQHQHQQQQQQNQYNQLHFANNGPYWNASSPVNNPDAHPNLFSSVRTQLPMPPFDEKPQNALEVKDTSTTTKKGGGDMNNKRGRNEAASSTLPPFKVRKEKMGDRITALQQLVSPFGKTDTASVLSEAIEYIKFLHEQVLCTPYLKSGASYQQQQQNNEKTKMDSDASKQDLRSRGLCLVPVSSTFPVAHETTVDFWTPAFGGTFR